jgi:predicted glycosyltransferase
MASKSAILGVPAVYVDTQRLDCIDMHEKNGLIFLIQRWLDYAYYQWNFVDIIGFFI